MMGERGVEWDVIDRDAAEVAFGLVRDVALRDRASSLYQIREEIGAAVFEMAVRPNPRWRAA
jgi:hypothetical protein